MYLIYLEKGLGDATTLTFWNWAIDRKVSLNSNRMMDEVKRIISWKSTTSEHNSAEKSQVQKA